MSRFSRSTSTSQRVRQIARDHYRLSWVVDYYYADSQLRFPRLFTRDTDKAGAERFAKKWRVEIRELETT